MSAVVRRFPLTEDKKDQAENRWLWRQAVLIVGQLPESDKDARAVLDYVKELLDAAPSQKKPA
jgi:hypothetical protein